MDTTRDAIALVGQANRKSLSAWKKLVGVSLPLGGRHFDRDGAVAELEDAVATIESALELLRSGQPICAPEDTGHSLAPPPA